MDNLEVKFSAANLNEATGEFSGYGAVFGNIDSHGDVIVPGAFQASLKSWEGVGRLPPMRLMHGIAGNPFSGSNLPIGVWKAMREDQNGLYVEGKISALNSDFGKQIYGLMKDGALGGLSIGYKAVAADKGFGSDQPKRTLREVKLVEISLVDEPSNSRSLVTAIKSAVDINTIREFEGFLRDVGGFSASEAKKIASGGYKALGRDGEADLAELADKIRSNLNTLKI